MMNNSCAECGSSTIFRDGMEVCPRCGIENNTFQPMPSYQNIKSCSSEPRYSALEEHPHVQRIINDVCSSKNIKPLKPFIERLTALAISSKKMTRGRSILDLILAATLEVSEEHKKELDGTYYVILDDLKAWIKSKHLALMPRRLENIIIALKQLDRSSSSERRSLSARRERWTLRQIRKRQFLCQ